MKANRWFDFSLFSSRDPTCTIWDANSSTCAATVSSFGGASNLHNNWQKYELNFECMNLIAAILSFWFAFKCFFDFHIIYLYWTLAESVPSKSMCVWNDKNVIASLGKNTNLKLMFSMEHCLFLKCCFSTWIGRTQNASQVEPSSFFS